MINITIIGLGPLGTSIGLALKKYCNNLGVVIGYDLSNKNQDFAKKSQAIDKTEWNIKKAVSDSDLIFICVPTGKVYEVLNDISEATKSGAVICDTSTAKRACINWVNNLFANQTSYIGINPLTAASLKTQNDSSPDVFHGAKCAIVLGKNASKESIDTVISILESFGSKMLFMDPDEHDSFAVATSTLPSIIAAAMINSVSESPSWPEISNFVGTNFDSATVSASFDPASTQGASLVNPDLLVYWIDQVQNHLNLMKSSINDIEDRHSHEGKLADSLVNAWEERLRLEIGVADNRNEKYKREPLPTSSESMMGLFFGNKVASAMSGKDESNDENNYDRRKLK
ncbi:MAG: hypothetical protein CL748_01530 [Chloroflexi bacterium]|nr:hypothetical protein [Chloroflexota bacterium]